MSSKATRMLDALTYLEASGLDVAQLSSLHHSALRGGRVSFAQAKRYFGVGKELQAHNDAFAERVLFVAHHHRVRPRSFDELVAEARIKWPL